MTTQQKQQDGSVLSGTFKCISCGNNADRLFRDFKSSGIIKIEHCKHCQNVVDKYIESEPVIIYLDAFLLKRQAFRHVLYNRKTQGHWKLAAILLLCDAFTKLVLDRPMSGDSPVRPDYVIYTALEWGLYQNFLLAVLELCITVLVIIGCIRTVTTDTFSPGELIHGMILSNFGKILVIPAVLWGTNYSHIYVSLSRVFVCAANTQAVRVLQPSCHFYMCVISVVLGHLVAMVTSSWIQEMLQMPG